MKKAFYLKTNRRERWAIQNLSRWLDVAYLMNADCYIVCDNDELKKQIEDELLLYSNPIFIKSIKNDELKYVVDRITTKNWENAAYAHLTTFYDAKEKGYTCFWNIDADDTRMLVTVDKITQILLSAELVARNKNVNCFSLDMWTSATNGAFWSFGITYTDNNVDWLRILKERCDDDKFTKTGIGGEKNIDNFFTYLKNVGICKNETFYVDNMKFIHYSTDFIEKPFGSGFFHWRNGKLIFPIIYYGLGIDKYGCYEIASDIIKLDIIVKDSEGTEIMAYYAHDGGINDLGEYYCIDSVVNSEIASKKNAVFLNKHGFSEANSPVIVCFGAGNAFKRNINKIKALYDVKYVCDNDETKWGQEICGVNCISPSKLAEFTKVLVIFTVMNRRSTISIEGQLENLNISYDYMDSWFRGIE